MYKRFFGLKENPFTVNPDPRFLYRTRQVEEALACLAYGIRQGSGFTLMSGEVGTGKTTLLNTLMEELRGQPVNTAFIFNPGLGVNQFLHVALEDFGIHSETRRKDEMLLQLNQWLLERYSAGERAVLIVDESQNLSLEVLEEIRLLTNLETAKEKLLQIVLSGQSEIEVLLRQPALRQLLQRITLRCRMTPLSPQDTRGYIYERLRIAGGQGSPIFTPDAVAMVYSYSGGIPRVINLLCENALISAFADAQRPVLAATIRDVGREFELDRPQEVTALTRAAQVNGLPVQGVGFGD
jgi:type II secretory pathway predicted ATPase ExeA